MFEIRRIDSYDFVVCGGGVTGFAAAVSAAKKGLNVALIERQGCLGGTATQAGVNHLLGGRKLDPATQKHIRVVGGIFDELTDALIAQGTAIEPNRIDLSFNPFGWYPRMASGIAFDETALKIMMDQMCEAAGVRVYYYTNVISASKDDHRITSIIVHNKDGLIEIKADCFADCTGDADLAALSGCSYKKGRDSDGLMTPCSMEMHLENVDGDEFVRYQNVHQSPKLVEIIEELKEKKIWNFPYEIFIAIQLIEKDIFMINTIRQVGVDGTSEASISQALAQGRKECIELFTIIKNHFPGFSNCRVRKIFDTIGVRETRRIEGDYTITVDDALNGMHYEDCIAATTYNFDLPDPIRPSHDPMMGDAKKPNSERTHVVIQIPFRCMLPSSISNLIVAGRCVSTEREVLGPVRIMGPCMQMGQAAGTAAFLALKNNNNFKTIDVKQLQSILWDDGVINPNTLPFN